MSKAQCVGVSSTNFTNDKGEKITGFNLFYTIQMIGVTGMACMKKFFRDGNDDFVVWEDLVKQAAGNEKNLPGKVVDIVFGPKGNIESIKLLSAS